MSLYQSTKQKIACDLSCFFHIEPIFACRVVIVGLLQVNFKARQDIPEFLTANLLIDTHDSIIITLDMNRSWCCSLHKFCSMSIEQLITVQVHWPQKSENCEQWLEKLIYCLSDKPSITQFLRSDLILPFSKAESWTLLSDQLVVKVLSAQNPRIICLEFEFFLGLLKSLYWGQLWVNSNPQPPDWQLPIIVISEISLTYLAQSEGQNLSTICILHFFCFLSLPAYHLASLFCCNRYEISLNHSETV